MEFRVWNIPCIPLGRVGRYNKDKIHVYLTWFNVYTNFVCPKALWNPCTNHVRYSNFHGQESPDVKCATQIMPDSVRLMCMCTNFWTSSPSRPDRWGQECYWTSNGKGAYEMRWMNHVLGYWTSVITIYRLSSHISHTHNLGPEVMDCRWLTSII